VLPLIVSAAFGYLLGSFPTAYVLVRWNSRVDIRTAGSGNVGTLNSYLVTNSKWVGILVLCIDLLKGVAAVMIARVFGAADPFLAQSVAGIAAVAGHNFPVWLGWKGGRGLATAAGVMLPLLPWAVALWVIAWSLAFAALRKVNPANALATLIVVLVAALLPGELLERFMPAGATAAGFRMLAILVMGLVLVRHIGPLKDFVQERRSKKGRTTQ